MNESVLKNELIFEYASGSLGPSKSIFASTYLYLNSKASKLNHTFENIMGDDLINNDGISPKKLTYADCLTSNTSSLKNNKNNQSPISRLVGPIDNIRWKQIYKGFSEFIPEISKTDNVDEIKLIKMEPGTSVPIHSHGGKEFILVLNGSFNDEYGKFSKGDMQINDQNIKHTPIACKDEGCICLTITEKDVIFFGRFGSILNLFTFIRSFFK